MAQPDDQKKYLNKDQIKDQEKKDNEDTVLPPDPETLHKTDPQENMKGPISSIMHSIEDKVEENDKEQPEDKK